MIGTNNKKKNPHVSSVTLMKYYKVQETWKANNFKVSQLFTK